MHEKDRREGASTKQEGLSKIDYETPVLRSYGTLGDITLALSPALKKTDGAPKINGMTNV